MFNNQQENIPVDHSATIRNSSTPSDLTAESQPQISWYAFSRMVSYSYSTFYVFCVVDWGFALCPDSPQESLKDRISKQAYSTTEKCCESTFRSVTELSLGGEKFSGLSTVDMVPTRSVSLFLSNYTNYISAQG